MSPAADTSIEKPPAVPLAEPPLSVPSMEATEATMESEPALPPACAADTSIDDPVAIDTAPLAAPSAT